MIDLHMHTVFSDGELIPAELTRRAAVAGYRAMAITDHGDLSNIDFIIPRIVSVCQSLGKAWGLTVLPGIEITHVPPAEIADAISRARGYGARLVVCHGETIVEPVAPGTNRAAILGGADILSHPGLITSEDVALAAEKGVFLEITARKGHSLTNGHVARHALKHGAGLVLNTDSHSPSDLISLEMARKVALGAGLTEAQFDQVRRNSESLVTRVVESK